MLNLRLTKKSLLNIDLININHDKEYKIFGSFDENAKSLYMEN